MFGLTGFAACDGEGCKEEHVLKIGLAPNSMLFFDVKQLTPEGWQVRYTITGPKLYCPACLAKMDQEHKKKNLTVVK